MRTFDYKTTIIMFDEFDENTLAELVAEVTFTYTPGTEPTGPTYSSGGEPGDPEELDFGPKDITFSIAGAPVDVPDWLRTRVYDQLIDSHAEHMCEIGREDLSYGADD